MDALDLLYWLGITSAGLVASGLAVGIKRTLWP